MDTVYNVLLEPIGCWLTVGIRVRLWAAVILLQGQVRSLLGHCGHKVRAYGHPVTLTVDADLGNGLV